MTSHCFVMFRHQIAQHTALINSKSFPEDLSAPGTPQNFSCITEITTQGVTLQWDPPSSGGIVFYYEIYRNDSFYANESDTVHQFSNPVNNDVFKVRAVGVRGLTSPFSNTCTYTGEGTLNVQGIGIPDRTSVHVLWQDISNSNQISFEGYNVYLDDVKQNSSLLPATVQGYGFFDKTVNQSYKLGVSFVHDGGQESGKFEVNVTAPGQGVRYGVMTRSRYITAPIVHYGSYAPRLRSGKRFGLAVKDGTQVSIFPEFSYPSQHRQREWSVPGSWAFTFRLNPFEDESKIFYGDGCNRGLSLVYNRIKQKVGITIGSKQTDDARFVMLIIKRSIRGFTFSGPACSGPDNLYLSATISLNEEDINDVGLYSSDQAHFIQLPTEHNSLIEFDNGNADDAVLIWSTFPSTPFYDVYIRTSGGSFPGTPNYEDLVAADNFLVIDNLVPGNYEAKVDFKYGDGSIAETSNILAFDIA